MLISLNISFLESRKFYIRQDNNKVDYIETGPIVDINIKENKQAKYFIKVTVRPSFCAIKSD